MDYFKNKLDSFWFVSDEVINLSRALLGFYLVTYIDKNLTVGRIVETEAYRAPEDKASHAYDNRLTKRTATMYAKGGVAYVYLIYGMYHLFNVVVGKEGVAHAILVRALEPVHGIEVMLQRRGMDSLSPAISNGPGKLSIAMGINKHRHNGCLLYNGQSEIWLSPDQTKLSADQIIATTRIGVDYAQEWKHKNWRFYIKDNKWVSKF